MYNACTFGTTETVHFYLLKDNILTLITSNDDRLWLVFFLEHPFQDL